MTYPILDVIGTEYVVDVSLMTDEVSVLMGMRGAQSEERPVFSSSVLRIDIQGRDITTSDIYN